MFTNQIFQNAANAGKTVNFTYNGTSRDVTVLAEGTSKFATVDTEGQFKVYSFAKLINLRVGSTTAKTFGFTTEYAQKALGKAVVA